MAISAPFSSVGEADSAYYGTDSSEDSGGGSRPEGRGRGTDATWGPLQEGGALTAGWVLAYQDQQNGDRQRWFVIRTVDGQLQAIQSSGEVYNARDTDTLADLPHYPTEDDAREAFSKWDGAEEGAEDTDDQWTEWQKIRQIDPWWIFSRSHESDDRVQFLVAGKRGDGSTVFLGPNGQPRDEPYLFESFNRARSAIEAYFQAVQNGDVPEADQPTGDAPSRTEIREAVRSSSQSSQVVEKLTERLAGQKVLMVAGGVAAIYLYIGHKEGTPS